MFLSSKEHDPVDSLLNIVENAASIADYPKGFDRATFGGDLRTRDAVEHCLEQICEAVVRLGDRAECLLPGHNVQDIRGMGNQLRHAYHRINLDIVWSAARQRVPALAADAQAAADRLQNPD